MIATHAESIERDRRAEKAAAVVLNSLVSESSLFFMGRELSLSSKRLPRAVMTLRGLGWNRADGNLSQSRSSSVSGSSGIDGSNCTAQSNFETG